MRISIWSITVSILKIVTAPLECMRALAGIPQHSLNAGTIMGIVPYI